VGSPLDSKTPVCKIGQSCKRGSCEAIQRFNRRRWREIEVKQVQEKFSIASPVSLNGTPDRGDKVVGTKIAAPLEFANKWKKPK